MPGINPRWSSIRATSERPPSPPANSPVSDTGGDDSSSDSDIDWEDEELHIHAMTDMTTVFQTNRVGQPSTAGPGPEPQPSTSVAGGGVGTGAASQMPGTVTSTGSATGTQRGPGYNLATLLATYPADEMIRLATECDGLLLGERQTTFVHRVTEILFWIGEINGHHRQLYTSKVQDYQSAERCPKAFDQQPFRTVHSDYRTSSRVPTVLDELPARIARGKTNKPETT
ncbi:hypothetical protein BJ508DRAFT_324802 [Ascobolus immersus RN42]|uniref:Uncharacterized protein n=1 Tax=Ascobolus immersus RN42 TaxID=1160509 RepID=A0A3N4IAU5_ASCIM|nr:hypothetical protein BJ508DRAFT_324802 [Ascobolus immersus RN42]